MGLQALPEVFDLEHAVKELAEHPELLAAMKRVIAYAEHQVKLLRWAKLTPDSIRFTSTEVGLSWQLLKKLVALGLLEAQSTARRTYYRIGDYETARRAVELAEKTLESLQANLANLAAPTKASLPPEAASDGIPDIDESFFDGIVGWDDIKRMFVRSIRALKKGMQIHILLVGPPASAKSLFLMKLAQLPRSYWTTGDGLSKAGLIQIFEQYNPRFLIIDEFEKVEDLSQYGPLLTLMEAGVVRYSKYKKEVTIPALTNVYAAANRVARIKKRMRELLSRFVVFELPPYTRKTFLEVVPVFLEKLYGVPFDVAYEVAAKVWDELKSQDPRDAVKIVKFLKAEADSPEEMKKALPEIVEIMKKYRPSWLQG